METVLAETKPDKTKASDKKKNTFRRKDQFTVVYFRLQDFY